MKVDRKILLSVGSGLMVMSVIAFSVVPRSMVVVPVVGVGVATCLIIYYIASRTNDI